jgi:hypothetical protein
MGVPMISSRDVRNMSSDKVNSFIWNVFYLPWTIVKDDRLDEEIGRVSAQMIRS